MSDRCSHGARLGHCDECAERYEAAQEMADLIAERLQGVGQATHDRRELEWWRLVFSCRFRSGNLPPVGTALLGSRFVLMVEDPEGGLREWTR